MNSSTESYTLDGIELPKLKASTISNPNLTSDCCYFFDYNATAQQVDCLVEGCNEQHKSLNTKGSVTSQLIRHLERKHIIYDTELDLFTYEG